MEISKVHTPPGFSLELLHKKKIKDAALLELKKDVQLLPQVKTGKCISFQVQPLCLPSVDSEYLSGNQDYQDEVRFLANI